MTRSVLAVLLTLVAFAAPAPAQDVSTREQDQIVVAHNTRDGSSLFKFAFEVRRVTSEVVDSQNVAIAYASCDACTTVALSVQILLVSGSPDVVTPLNLAVALNEQCSSCTTFASAQQFVYGGVDPLRLTGQGRRRLAQVRRAFQALRREDLTAEELAARVDELGKEIRAILAEELVAIRQDDDAGRDESEDDDEPRDRGNEDGDGAVTTPAEPQEQPAQPAPAQTTPAPAQTTPAAPPPAQTTPTQTAPAETTPTQTTTQPPAETTP